MPDRPEGPRHRAVVERSLRVRVRIYLVIFAVALVLCLVDAVRAGVEAIPAVLLALAVAGVTGLVVSRMFALSWDAENRQVIGRIDTIGAAILVAYILFSVFRIRLVEFWFDGDTAAAVGMAVLAGIMLGQLVGTRHGVRQALALAWGGEARRRD